MSAVVHHYGAGTTAASIRAGVLCSTRYRFLETSLRGEAAV